MAYSGKFALLLLLVIAVLSFITISAFYEELSVDHSEESNIW